MSNIDLATDIVKKLVKEGHIAYFAGGWVRDYVMGHPSADIDIATDASPERIISLFPNTIKVGMSFGVIIVVLENHGFEIATFRKDIGVADGRRPIEIQPSSPVEDALRRDFTINGMFYNPLDKSVLDYVHGTEDIKKGLIRSIGNPHERFFEDRLRMIRAVRFAARFGFHIAPDTQAAIREHADRLLPAVSMERIWQEFKKMAADGHMDRALIEMHELQLLQVIFPELASLHLNDLKNSVKNFLRFPKETPTIVYLLHLFPNKNSDEVEFLCRYLKVSNRDIAFSSLFVHARQLLQRELGKDNLPEDFDWVRFYSNPDSKLILDIFASQYDPDDKEKFNYRHFARKRSLESHIERMQQNKPLITSYLLERIGIKPGKEMGTLLKEAERISINRNIHDPQEVLKILIKNRQLRNE